MSIYDDISSIVREQTKSTDLHALYQATVELEKDDRYDVSFYEQDKFGKGFSGLPCTYGLPGASAVLQPGNRVCVGWNDGERTSASVKHYVEGKPKSLKLEADEEFEIIIGSTNVKITQTKVEITATSEVVVSAPSVKLGDGGAFVARVGDIVNVDPVTHAGTITASTNTKVKA